MAAENEKKGRTAEHEESRREKARQRVQPAVCGPEIHEHAGEKNMESYIPVDCPVDRQGQVKEEVGRIQQCSFKAAQRRDAGKNVWIPQRQIPAAQMDGQTAEPGEVELQYTAEILEYPETWGGTDIHVTVDIDLCGRIKDVKAQGYYSNNPRPSIVDLGELDENEVAKAVAVDLEVAQGDSTEAEESH